VTTRDVRVRKSDRLGAFGLNLCLSRLRRTGSRTGGTPAIHPGDVIAGFAE